MPSSTRSRKSAAGGGSIRKKCVTRNGKEYMYWEARVSVGFDPGTGKQIQKSITGQTQKEVRLKMQEIIRQVDAGSYKEPCKLTLAQWLDMWTAEYLNNLKRLTQEQYRMQCTYYLKPCLGAAKLSALNTHMIQQFINSLSNGERAELPDNRFHDLRHSFAVNSLQAGDNIKNVQANLGHATSAFTMDVYCHVSQSMARESAARTQAFYESVKPV